jgi:type IV pilus assembly protein PilC
MNLLRQFLAGLARMGLRKDLEYLTHNLGLLMGAGVDVVSALESIESGVKSKQLRGVIRTMRDELSAGDTLSNVFDRSNLFPSRVVLLLRIGEQSGQLASQFKMIGIQEEKQRALRSKLRSALLYPTFIFSVALIVGLGVSWYILPRLARVFLQMKIELPLITKIVLGFGSFLGKYGVIAIPLILITLVVIAYFLAYHEKTRWIGERIVTSIPGVRLFVQEVELARLGALLGSLLQAGVPILDAIESLKSATQSYRYKALYAHLGAQISDGESLKDALASYKDVNSLLPQPVQQIIVVGSQSGTLSEVLTKIATVYEEKSDTSTRNLSVILEPLLLFIVWLAVVGVALGVILPIYNLIGGIHR